MKSSNFVSKRIVLCVSLCITATMAALMGCGDDEPTRSSILPPEDWPVYVTPSRNVDTLLRFWPVANRVDTLVTAVAVRVAPGISPDGELLYLGSSEEVAVVSTEDPQTVLHRFDCYCTGNGPRVSPTGTHIAVEQYSERVGWDVVPNHLLFLDPSLTVLYQGNDETFFGDVSFSADGSLAYHVADTLFDSIRVYDLSQTPVIAQSHPVDSGTPFYIEHIPGTSRVLLNLHQSSDRFVAAVYDLALDSIVFLDERYHTFPFRMVASHDGTHAYYGIHPSAFVEYDVANNRILREVSTESALPCAPQSFVARSIAISPDDRLLFLQTDVLNTDGGMLTYDLVANRFISFQRLPFGRGRIVVQSAVD